MLRNKKIIIGTRGSRLSLAQTEHFRDELLLAYPGVKADQLVIKIIKTSGDKFKTENLGMMGGKGLFVKELEECLLEKTIDVAVHSLKDVPTFSSNKLSLSCFLKRTDERDAFLSPIASSFLNLKPGSTVGTSSVRRFAQLKRLRSDLKIIPMRGNIDTRINKMKEGIFDSIVLAASGLKRLGFHSEVKQFFEKDLVIPAAGQGVVTVQCRDEDLEIKEILKVVNDKETQILAEAERSLLEVLNGACDTPVGANAIINDEGELFLQAELLSLDGTKSFRAHKTGIAEKAKNIGIDVAEEILSKAGDNFIISETKLAHTIHKKSE
jgi:hydroxymethylbilane synthase